MSNNHVTTNKNPIHGLVRLCGAGKVGKMGYIGCPRTDKIEHWDKNILRVRRAICAQAIVSKQAIADFAPNTIFQAPQEFESIASLHKARS
jgi:hypothetical protein